MYSINQGNKDKKKKRTFENTWGSAKCHTNITFLKVITDPEEINLHKSSES